MTLQGNLRRCRNSNSDGHPVFFQIGLTVFDFCIYCFTSVPFFVGHDFPAEACAAFGAADPRWMVGGRAEPHR